MKFRAVRLSLRFMWNFICLTLAGVAVIFLLRAARMGSAPQPSESQPTERRIDLGMLRPDSLYGITVSVKDPAAIQGKDSIHVTIADAAGPVTAKWLHSADLDFYLTLRPRAPGRGSVLLTATQGSAIPALEVAANRIPMASKGEPAVIATYPN